MATTINVGPRDGDVITLKLSSGEEIIGRYEGEDDQSVFLSKPLTILPNPHALQMMQSIFSMDMNQSAPVGFRKQAIIVQVPTKADLASHYLQNTTGIAMAEPKGVLLG